MDVNIWNANINVDINYLQGYHMIFQDSFLYVISSTVLLRRVFYHVTQAASSYNSLDIILFQIEDDIYAP